MEYLLTGPFHLCKLHKRLIPANLGLGRYGSPGIRNV